MQIFRLLLLPISWVYGLTVRMRNVCYRRGWFSSERGAIPTIIVGNISMGGTGKTPHTRWLVEQLTDLHPAILSRGYGRKTRGFRWVRHPRASTGAQAEVPHPELHGDEPVMYAHTLPDTTIAVCEDRLEGVRQIAANTSAQSVILDDALQHRRLRGDVQLALLRYDRLPHRDEYFPAGTLRDHRSRLEEVDALIITHCQDQPTAEILAEIQCGIRSTQTIPVYISRTHYRALQQVSGEPHHTPLHRVIVITGIAHTTVLMNYLNTQVEVIKHFKYPDHHAFTPHEMQEWQAMLSNSKAEAIITTEKDFVRFRSMAESIPVFVQPIQVAVEQGEELLRLIRQRIEESRTRAV